MKEEVTNNNCFTDKEISLIKNFDEYHLRIFLALKANELGRHGVLWVSKSTKVSKRTIYKGINEIKNNYSPPKNRIRKQGGGRKSILSKNPYLITVFQEIVKPYTAGLPQDEKTIWISKSPKAIAKEMTDKGHNVSEYVVRQIIEKLGYRKRSFTKDLTMKETENRDAQFVNIEEAIAIAAEEGTPIISIDTKKKELVGNFKRSGSVYCIGNPKSYDHDFKTNSETTIVPHGIYDIQKNIGYMTIGVSHDTSEFVCNNIERVWNESLHNQYPDAKKLIILCDGGGSNSSSHHIVKQDFMKLATRLGISLIITHYPPYCSKWNPIEHRLFSQITRSWSGAPLLTVDNCVERAAATTTSKGLKVYVHKDLTEYNIKRPLDENYKENVTKQIVFDDKLPKWNYVINPA